MPVARYMSTAQATAMIISEALKNHGLPAEAAHFVLAETRPGAVWLFVVFDPQFLPFLAPYLGGALQHWIALALPGRRVRMARGETPRLGILLSPPAGRKKSLRGQPPLPLEIR